MAGKRDKALFTQSAVLGEERSQCILKPKWRFVLAQQSALEQAFGQFLDERRNADCTLNDAMEDFPQRLCSAATSVLIEK